MLLDLSVLVERDLSYHRRLRRKRTFSPEANEVQSQVTKEDREKVTVCGQKYSSKMWRVKCLFDWCTLYSQIILLYILLCTLFALVYSFLFVLQNQLKETCIKLVAEEKPLY
jgi:hypothetical protein